MPYPVVTLCSCIQAKPIILLKCSLTSAVKRPLSGEMAILKLKKLHFLSLCFSDQIQQSVKGFPIYVPSLRIVQTHFLGIISISVAKMSK